MWRAAAALLLALGMAGPAVADWSMPEFMISFWGRPDAAAQRDAHNPSAQAIAEAGFNTVMCKPEVLDECRKHGLKALLIGVTPEQAANLRDDTVVCGYFLQDEPKNDRFHELAERAKAFRQADPNHPVYINLSQENYPRAFVEKVHPQFLSYDLYWWWWKRDYFPMLEEYRDVAQSAGIPLICWVEVNAGPDSEHGGGETHLLDNLQRLRCSVYCALAYGVKGIQWFQGRLIFEGSQLTPSGKDVAVLNAELKRLGPVLMKLHSIDVFHTPGPALSLDISIGQGEPVPTDTRALPNHNWVLTATPHVILGMLQDEEKNDFIMVINRRIDKEQDVALRFDVTAKPVNKIERFDKQTGQWVELPLFDARQLDLWSEWAKLRSFWRRGRVAVEFTLAPGDGELLRVPVTLGE